MAKSSLSFKTSSHSICSPRRTSNLPRSKGRCWRNDDSSRRTRWSNYREYLETPNWLHSRRAYHESWCTMQHSSETGSSPSFPCAIRNPLWFHVIECLEMKPRNYSTTKPCRKPCQEIMKVLFRNWRQAWALQLYDHASEPTEVTSCSKSQKI